MNVDHSFFNKKSAPIPTLPWSRCIIAVIWLIPTSSVDGIGSAPWFVVVYDYDGTTKRNKGKPARYNEYCYDNYDDNSEFLVEMGDDNSDWSDSCNDNKNGKGWKRQYCRKSLAPVPVTTNLFWQYYFYFVSLKEKAHVTDYFSSSRGN